ncbi:Hsp20/alpha crystallin family protein [Micromonospora cathayae]|uniref:Hsp20/alpha crystallin family protein n=1 Tax=Micromonospora cathayae TaxID=3028804 RepID=A0ABY7ZWN0_9ACTN|nr:Hsp20/alpha crystallin family protein [Micromonospora sp. HUAS 3]WDZ86423.1 Hsp20/alpha crystallin family protein [Micromonospora sp. HUAS 3]
MSEPHGDGSGRGWRGRQPGGWDPMGELQSLRAELSRLVGGRSGPPEVELTETADGWEVVVRLPGVAPEEVAVELDDRELCVRARSEAEVNADHGIPGGLETRGFEYRIDLPSRVEPDAIDAVMDHGLLRVRLPRAARPAPRTITIGQLRSTNGSRGHRGSAASADRGTPGLVDRAAERELHHPDATDEIDRP